MLIRKQQENCVDKESEYERERVRQNGKKGGARKIRTIMEMKMA